MSAPADPPPEVLLWDLDGTLVHWSSKRIYTDATWLHWRWLARHFGWRRAVHHGTATYLRMLRHETDKTNAEFFVEEMARRLGVSTEEIAEIEARFLEEGVEPLRRLMLPIPPGLVVLDRARASGRFRMVAATNPTMPQAFGHRRLRWVGVDPEVFELVTGTETASRMKQHPRFHEELCERLGVEPSRCLMIGNDARKDLIAQTVGIRVFLLENGFERNLRALPHLTPDAAGDYEALARYLGLDPEGL